MAIRRFSNSSIATGSKSSKLWDGETFPGYFESIATTVVGSSGASTVVFDNIPQNYTHLQLRYIAKDANASTIHAIPINIRFNSDDSSSNYSIQRLFGDGSTAVSTSFASGTYSVIRNWTSSISNIASTYGVGIVDILEYRNTNRRKVVRGMGGSDANGSGAVGFSSGVWLSNNAITSMTIWTDEGNLVQGSHFALYGIRGA